MAGPLDSDGLPAGRDWRRQAHEPAAEPGVVPNEQVRSGGRVLTELELCRTLDHAASVLGDPEPTSPSERRDRVVPSRQRLAAVAVLAEREPRLPALQRLALVDAAAGLLSEPDGGDQLAHALLSAACPTEVTTEQVYLALITPPENPDDHSEGLPS